MKHKESYIHPSEPKLEELEKIRHELKEEKDTELKQKKMEAISGQISRHQKMGE